MDGARVLTLTGLLLTMAGSALLFFYGLPKKQYGNVTFYGDLSMQSDALPWEREIPEHEWKAEGRRFQERARFLNKTGFALLLIGTMLQAVGTWISPS